MAQTFTLNVGAKIFGDQDPPRLSAKVWPIADSVTKRKLKYLRDTVADQIITGHAEAKATPQQLAARMLPIPGLPDPRDTTYDPSGFGLLVEVDAYFFKQTFLFGATEIAAHISGGVVQLEDVIAGEIASFTSVGVPYVIEPALTNEVARAQAAEATKVNSSTYTAGLAGKQALQQVAATVTASGVAVVNKHNPVNASGGAKSLSLPTGQVEGSQISVEKTDSSTNTVAVTGSIRGVGSSTISLSYLSESLMLRADSAGSWWPISGHRTKTSLDTAYAKRVPTVASLPSPFIIPHGGGGDQIAPTDTIESARIGATLGLGVIDGGNWRSSSDGTLVCVHDATVDVRTTSTGNVSDLSAMAVQRLVVDASAWFGGNFTDTTIPTFEQFLGLAETGIIISPEPKDSAATATLLAAAIARRGLQASMFPTAFNATWLQPFIDVGCTDVMLNITSMPDSATQAAYTAQGIKWLGIDVDGAVTPANLATLKTAGFKIMLGTMQRASGMTSQITHAYDWTTVLSSIDAYASDDPLYFAHALDATKAARFQRTSDPFRTRTYWHGHHVGASTGLPLNGTPYRGSYRQGGWSPWQATPVIFASQGWAYRGTAASRVLEGDVAHEVLPADTTRWAGIIYGMPTDVGYADAGVASENCYQLFPRANGQLNLAKKVNGVGVGGTQTVSLGAFSAPVTLNQTIAVGASPTTLTVTALATALPKGARLVIPDGDGTVATLTAAAVVSATSLSVTLSKPTAAAVASGAVMAHIGRYRLTTTSTSVIASRIDSPVVLTGALTSGVAITTLAVEALPFALANNTILLLPTGQVCQVNGAVTAGATSITVFSVTPSAAIGVGSAIYPSVQLLDTAYRSGYVYFGQRVDASQTAQMTFLNWTVTP